MKKVVLFRPLHKLRLGIVPVMQFIDCSKDKLNKCKMALLSSEFELVGRYVQPGVYSSELRVPGGSARR
jgi:hypothetical protein